MNLPPTSSFQSIQLHDVPLTRDSIFYMAAVTLLAFIISDGRVMWYESLSMLVLYSMYIL
ncbi:Hypothetical predicted protein, partial [Olea europaea subsp. europaea]